VELDISASLTDIVSERFDAGVRLGESVDKDMVAVRIGPDVRMVVVGAPAYFGRRPKPRKPQDLANHACINLRLPTSGGLYAWELQKGRREMKVRVDGSLVFSNTGMIVRAAVAGFGLGFVMQDQVTAHLENGSLVTVLDDWCPPFGGYYLYYPSRRQPMAAFALLVEALRYRD
jgi:DNA-binding transcriptional LysR family regulator